MKSERRLGTSHFVYKQQISRFSVRARRWRRRGKRNYKLNERQKNKFAVFSFGNTRYSGNFLKFLVHIFRSFLFLIQQLTKGTAAHRIQHSEVQIITFHISNSTFFSVSFVRFLCQSLHENWALHTTPHRSHPKQRRERMKKKKVAWIVWKLYGKCETRASRRDEAHKNHKTRQPENEAETENKRWSPGGAAQPSQHKNNFFLDKRIIK